ncbi:MAG TPA: glucose 1-dehydrogenase [Sphingobium sp.]|uniref:SDR family NAD(P)-dependent oxidoreductase n=1 Tax=Sphingobium sp. TaxID=1912891 RepID=UPI002ED09521
MGFLDDQVALVTGAGRGLGRACANILAREGAHVVVVDIDMVSGEDTAAQIRSGGGSAVYVRADISRPVEVEAMVDTATKHFGRLDCAINNAMLGIPRQPLADISLEDWRRAAAVNIEGTFLCMKYEIPAMLAANGGAIVNIGSGRENTGMPGLSWYLGAKQAIYGMTKCAALDYAEQGLRINAVAPGPMWTPALRDTAASRPGHLDAHLAHIPMRRIAEPEEVAEAAVWLCSPAASYITGVTLSADGGYTLG